MHADDAASGGATIDDEFVLDPADLGSDVFAEADIGVLEQDSRTHQREHDDVCWRDDPALAFYLEESVLRLICDGDVLDVYGSSSHLVETDGADGMQRDCSVLRGRGTFDPGEWSPAVRDTPWSDLDRQTRASCD